MRGVVTRRDFLAAAGAAAAVAALPRWTTAAAQPARMFLSLNGAVAPRVGPWPEFARLAARVGYRGIDWSFAPVKAAGADATRALLAELQLQATIVNLPVQQPFAGDDAAFKEKLAALPDDAALAAAIGCTKMMLVLSPTGALPKDQQRALVRDRLAAIAAILQTSNIRLGLEFLGPLYMHAPAPPPAPAPTGGTNAAAAPARGQGGPRIPFIWTMPETVALAKDAAPNVGVVLDAWHWHHSGGTIADIHAAGASRIVHVHISDAKPMPPEDVRDNMRVMPGEGIIDLVGFLQALQQVGYTGGVSPEPLGRIPADMSADDAAKLGYDTTLAVMQKAGVVSGSDAVTSGR